MYSYRSYRYAILNVCRLSRLSIVVYIVYIVYIPLYLYTFQISINNFSVHLPQVN